MAEDQRSEALASQEAIEAAKIASQRYGAQLDYDAALAKLDQDERESLRTAQTNILKEQLGGDIAAARDALDDIENNSEYQQEFMRLSAEFGDNPAKLRAELAAVAAELVANRQDIYRSTVGGKDAGGFKAELPSGE